MDTFCIKALIDNEGEGGEGASKTSGLKLTSANTESIGGGATTQQEVNEEFTTNFKKALIGWIETTAYKKNDDVYYQGRFWTSKVDANLGNKPSDANSDYWMRTFNNCRVMEIDPHTKIWHPGDLITYLFSDWDELDRTRIRVRFFFKEETTYTEVFAGYELTDEGVCVSVRSLPRDYSEDFRIIVSIQIL